MRTKFFGHALFELPRPHQLPPIMVNLSKEETLIYRYVPPSFSKIREKKTRAELGGRKLTCHRRVEDRFRRKVSAEWRAQGHGGDKVGKCWLIYVLRLKQAASHPFLLESVMKKHFEEEDILWLIEELSHIQTTTPFIHQVGRWCEEQLQIRQMREGSHHPAELDDGLGAEFDMIRQLERVKNHTQEEVVDLCRMCGSVPDDPFQPKVRFPRF